MPDGVTGPHWIRNWINRWSVIGMLLGVGTGWVMLTFTVGSAVRHSGYNWLYALRRFSPPTNAVVVYLDEQAHFELKQPLNAAWDRTLHARLLDRLTRAGAKAVVFDIVFLDSGRGENAADLALANAARTNGRVIVGANPRHDRSQIETAVDLPYDALRDAVDDRWGLVEMEPEPDQVVRRHPPSYPPFKHSLAWTTALFLGAAVTRTGDESAIERAETAPRWINYYGPAYALPHCNFAEALDPARTPDAYFTNRIVFVGASTLTRYSGERKDAYRSPFSNFASVTDDSFIPGVEIQATCTLNLLRGDWLRRLPDTAERAIVVVLGLVAGFGFVNLRPKAATAAFVGLEALVITAALVGFHEFRTFGSWLIWVDQVGVAFLYGVCVNSFRLYLQNQLLEQTVASYVGPKLARKYVREKKRDFLKPGASKQELTIFFSDIAHFTSISEGMDSSALASHMNQYFEGAVGQCIQATDGTVVKYIGDAIFAFWNAPDPQPDHAERACEAALRFRERPVEEMNGRPLITRIGLHSGVANVGNFGSSARVDYTALGENINLASRMEGLNKHLGTQTLITGETHHRVEGRFAIRPLGRFVLKGFERVVEVFELTGRRDQAAAFAARDAAFAAALAEFKAARFDTARAGFGKVLEVSPEDGPSQFYLRTIEAIAQIPPAAGWAGEVELQEK